jgi:ABC-type uncharacterized transport system substrate-binding protein
LKQFFLLWLLWLPCAYATNSYAASSDVLISRIDIVIPADNAALTDLAGGMQRALQQLQPTLPITIRYAGSPGHDTQTALAIPVGDGLLPWIDAEKNNYAATLAFYVSSINYQNQLHNDEKVSALYRDQPLSRQLQLAKLLLPNLRRVAIIHGHRHLPQSNAVLEYSSALQIHTLDIEDKIDWPKYLSQLLQESDVLLAVEDSTIYNSDTIRSILLTTYRHGKFLIGPGRSFVNAGSLASCYTISDQYLKQLTEMVGALLRTRKLPAPQYPRAFRVALNPRVAMSLGLAVQDENTLTARLLNQVEECGDGC